MTVHREHKVTRENQQDATNSMFIIKLSISTCFGHKDSTAVTSYVFISLQAAGHGLILLMMGIMMPETC